MLHPLHEALLALALVPEVSPEDCWDRLHDEVMGLDDEGTGQLLPLVHRRLVDAGVAGPEVEALGRLVRDTWLQNQFLFLDVEAAIDVLDAAGVAHLALKGVPLALAHYPDVSLRPMVDFDLLVHPDSAPAAVDALREAGWTIEWALHPDFVARTCEVPSRPPETHGILDLHWRLVPWVGRSWTAPDPELWAAAEPLAVGRRATLAPAPHDLLLHVLLHAYRSGWAEVPRWVADVVMLLRSAEGSFDWDRFVARVGHGHLALPVTDSLTYVAGTFGAPVPDAVLRTLRAMPVTRRERRKHRRVDRPITEDRHWLYGEGSSLRTSWWPISVNYTRRAELASVQPFLRGRLHVDRLWTAPFVVTWRRLRRLLGLGVTGDAHRVAGSTGQRDGF